MKKSLAILLAMITFSMCHAQLSQLKTRFYEMKFPTVVTECSIVGTAIKDSEVLAPDNAKFTIVSETEDNYVITFWNFNSSSKEYSVFNKDGGANPKQKYFLIAKSSLENLANPYFKERPNYTLGTVVIPLKVRATPKFDFSKDFSLGLSIGIKFRTSNYKNEYVIPVFFSSVTSITLDSLSTEGRIKERTDVVGYSVGGGFVFDFEGGQIGAFGGYDHVTRMTDYNWKFHGRPWFSIGIGFALFTPGDDSNRTHVEGSN